MGPARDRGPRDRRPAGAVALLARPARDRAPLTARTPPRQGAGDDSRLFCEEGRPCGPHAPAGAPAPCASREARPGAPAPRAPPPAAGNGWKHASPVDLRAMIA